MKKWQVFHLLSNGEINTNETVYEFSTHNPIRFTKKIIMKYKNMFPYGFTYREVK